MYLSKLEMVGFKSFAQKVALTFDSGISAIVGPNGCGKTNIVDAIRWVLGEQRYSALRSEKMEDVIFNGTKGRKPLGMAEASLVIENTKGILPSEYTQVTVGRRVFRSGESEYLLNKVPCRLKDILDLFMDTGMGADAYSVIELKMIETILSDKTDERRRLFEEAAGVTKYKHRRKAAYRKLESVQADLVRVNDIVAEVQKAVNSLERQARRAEQFNEVKARLRGLEIDLMEREYAQYHGRLLPLRERQSALGSDKSKMDTELRSGESGLDERRTRLLETEKRLSDAQRDVALHLEKTHRVEEKVLVSAERKRSLEANVLRLEGETRDLLTERAKMVDVAGSLRALVDSQRERERDTEQELMTRQSELLEFGRRVDEQKQLLQSLNEKIIALLHEIADRQTELDLKRGRIENLRGRIAHTGGENAAYEQDILRIDGEIAALSEDDKLLRRSYSEAEMKFYNAELRKAELRARLEGLQRKELEITGEIQRLRARMDFLKGLVESREGLPEGARFLSKTDRWKPTRNLTVADAVHAEERFRTAIEAALGEYAGLIVVENVRDAEKGIQLLKDEGRGKAAFVCLDRIPEIRSMAPLPRFDGVHGWAVDLAKYEPTFEPLFRLLLDRVLVVQDSATAMHVVTTFSGVRCVTLEGEIATGIGIARGGSKRQDEGGTIGKQKQIEEIGREIARHQGALDDLAKTRAAADREHDAIELKAFTDAVKEIEKEMSGVEMRIAQLAFEKNRAAEGITRNKGLTEEVSAEAAALEAEIESEAPGVEALKAGKAEVERSVGGVTREIQDLEQQWNERSRVVNDLAVALATLRGEIQNALNDQKRREEADADASASLEKHAADARASREEILATEASIVDHNNELAVLRQELTVLEAGRGLVEEEAARLREEIHRLELNIKDKRRSHDDSLRALHDVELKIADLTAKADHIKARAAEEFEYAVELKSYPENEFVDFAALREEIQGLREKLKNLGNINFAAFEEYKSEKERFEFLTAQRNDLLEAEKTLLATIEEINSTAQKKFLDTFALIRSNFIATFKSLFDPGDECDLRLEEGVDPLEAGIEISAKPRGKRPTSIDLLSGGEKTLTAIALLFAIYLVKPSPFCILDEVDAPLDDANIDRFTRILDKFSNNTQFIVVTHNKRTMEAANALYGVTMEEEGVSKLVTVRFNQSAQVASAVVA